MTDTLRTRIAAVLCENFPVSVMSEYSGLAMADALIRELEADYILVPKSHTLARNTFKYGEHYGI